MSWADHVARQRIRQAQERGEFDNLPLAGRPLDLGDPHDPDWWLKRYLRDNGVSGEDVLPAPLALRREAEQLPDSLQDVPGEAAVREIVEDFNRRVRLDHLTPTPVPMPHARVVDVEEMVAQWRDHRSRRPAPPDISPDSDRFGRTRPVSGLRGFVRRVTVAVFSPGTRRTGR